MTRLRTLGLTLALSAGLAGTAAAQQYGPSGYHQRGGDAAIVYAHPDFRGQSVRVTGPVDTLKRYGLNDRVSSIRITGGSWEVCVDPNFRGRCEILDWHEGALNEWRLNDKITSIRPVTWRGGRGGHDRYNDPRDWRSGRDRGYDQRGHDAPILLFRDPDFKGASIGLDGAVRSLAPLNFNDTVSSIAVRDGAWEICAGPDFTGRCEVITGSVAATSHYRLNDNITSIRPARGGYGRRW